VESLRACLTGSSENSRQMLQRRGCFLVYNNDRVLCKPLLRLLDLNLTEGDIVDNDTELGKLLKG
jgi:hypothetical protein